MATETSYALGSMIVRNELELLALLAAFAFAFAFADPLLPLLVALLFDDDELPTESPTAWLITVTVPATGAVSVVAASACCALLYAFCADTSADFADATADRSTVALVVGVAAREASWAAASAAWSVSNFACAWWIAVWSRWVPSAWACCALASA